MRTRVVVGGQVKAFLESLAPEPRRKVWRTIKGLGKNQGDVKQLEGQLAAYWRLRVDRIRVVFEERAVKGERVLFCFYAGYRGTVYAVLEQLLASGLVEEVREENE